MKRISLPELLDTDACPPQEVEVSLRDLGRINHLFGGVSTTTALIKRVALTTGRTQFSVLEVAAGLGDVPLRATRRLARQGIALTFTFLDRVHTHLPKQPRVLAADALALPFADSAFDLLSCNLFAHHLEPEQFLIFVKEALRVSRRAVIINDLVRHPAHLALVYAGFALMRSHISRVDGLTSVRRAYVPEEIQRMLAGGFPQGRTPRFEIFRHYLFRMGIMVWKDPA